MWDLIKEVFDGKQHPWRTLALVMVLLGIGAFSVWKTIPDAGRLTLLRPFLESYTARHAPQVAKQAADSADFLERSVPIPLSPIALQLFTRSSDSGLDASLLQLLSQRGLSVNTRPAIRAERSNAVWCGRDVTNGECVLVALRMVQVGFLVKQISRLATSDGVRASTVQIGYNDNLGTAQPYSVSRLMALSRTQIPIDRTPP